MGVDPASIAVKAALMAAQMAITASNKTEGPRLDSLDVSLADYGTPIRRFWGIRRLEGVPVIWAEKLREKKVTSKGKGGKTANYKYYGTWAVLLADHGIDAMTRIWFDKHLVWQSTGAGPVAPVVGIAPGRNMRVYLGTEDQSPDPRMEAWCEDRYGADSCPAYRGNAYIVFENIPLEKLGNRIPQVTVEAVSAKAPIYPREQKTSAIGLVRPRFNADYTRMYVRDASPNTTEIWDVANRTRLMTRTFPVDVDSYDIGDSGAVYMLDGFDVYSTGPDIGGVTTPATAPYPPDEMVVIGDTVYLTALTSHNYAQMGNSSAIVAVDVGFKVTHYCADEDGGAWAVGTSGFTIHFYPLGVEGASPFSIASPSAASTAVFALDNGDGALFCRQGSSIFTVSKAGGLLLSATAAHGGGGFDRDTFAGAVVGSGDIWFSFAQYSTSTLAILQVENQTNWDSLGNDWAIYDPVSHAIIKEVLTGKDLVWCYLDRVGSDGVTLKQIVDDVAGWCGVVGAETTALDQVIAGYSVAQGSGKDMIAPLLDIHDSDARPHDFGIEFIKRGVASSGSIVTADFVRDGDEPRYKVAIQQDTDLPRRLAVNFADVGKDQQANTVISQRPLDSVDGVREQTIDLTTYVTTPPEAQQLSDRRFRRQWNERETIENGITMKHLGLEPGDVRELSLDGLTRYARLEKMTLTQGRIDCEWRRDALSLNGLGSGQGAVMEGRDPEVVYIPSETKGIFLDIPLLDDTHSAEAPLLYYAAGNYGLGTWPGATAYKSDFAGDDYEAWNGIDSAAKAAWGYSTEALGDANPNLWDRGNSVNVQTFGGSYASCTEAEIDADPDLNLAMLGDEAINFTTATLEADGSYTFSGLKRGRRGTEWAMSDHANGEVFVLVESLALDALGLSEVGVDLGFKAQTIGRDPTYAPVTDIAFAGRSLMPYAPARVKATFDGTDWIFIVVRRTRVGGAWVGGAVIALSENSEAYEIEVYSGATLKRTLTLTGTNAVTYSNAQQVTDFGSTQTTKPSLIAYQISDAVGRGFSLAA